MYYYILHTLILTFLVFLWKKKLKNHPLEKYFYPAIAVKMLACVGYGIVYIKLYKGEGDTLNYFRDVSALVQLFYKNPSDYIALLFGQYYNPDIHFTNDLIWRETRMFVFVKICSIFQIIIGNDYRVMSIYMSLLSFYGIWYLCNKISFIFPNKIFSIVISFLFLPSALMWSSGYSKESIVMWAFGIVIGNWIMLFFKTKFGVLDWILFILGNLAGLFVLFLIKFYYVASLVPALFAGYFSYIIYEKFLSNFFTKEKNDISSSFLKYTTIFSIYAVIFMAFVVPLMYLHPAFWFENLMFNIIYNHNVMYLQSSPDDLIHYSARYGRGYINLDVSILNMIYNAPNAFLSIVFRPFVWESGGNKLKLLASMENFLLLGFFIMNIFLYVFKNKSNEQNIEKTSSNYLFFIISMCVFVVVLYTLLALASPNLGSLSRYRVVGHSWVWFWVLSVFFELKGNEYQR